MVTMTVLVHSSASSRRLWYATATATPCVYDASLLNEIILEANEVLKLFVGVPETLIAKLPLAAFARKPRAIALLAPLDISTGGYKFLFMNIREFFYFVR